VKIANWLISTSSKKFAAQHYYKLKNRNTYSSFKKGKDIKKKNLEDSGNSKNDVPVNDDEIKMNYLRTKQKCTSISHENESEKIRQDIFDERETAYHVRSNEGLLKEIYRLGKIKFLKIF